MNPAIANCIAQGGTVVTATRRLARELRRQCDHEMVESGRKAWESADILPWEAWLQRCWDEGPGAAGDAPLVLSDPQLKLAWRGIIERDVENRYRENSPLWNIEATAGAAIATLRLMRDWRISIADLPASRHPDHAGFLRWLQEFGKVCERHGWIDRFQLAERLASSGGLPAGSRVLLAGFDDLASAQQAVVSALHEDSAEVEVLLPTQGDMVRLPCQVYVDAAEQWRAAAAWARDCLVSDPRANIAIVVPDLSSCREDLSATLTEALAPAQVARPGESRELPFHLSLGDRLAAHPLARGLMDTLTPLATGTLTLEAAEALLLAPTIGDHEAENLARARAALGIRGRLPWNHTIGDLLHALEHQGCPLLAARLQNAHNRIAAIPERAPWSMLSATITDLMNDLGWPGASTALDSDQYQASEAIREQVLRLATLEVVRADTSLAGAVAELGRQLAARTFQPEAGDAALAVLDIREAAGLTFDYAWFADLSGERWPAPAIPDPFIPVGVQKAFGCPGADPEVDTRIAERQHRRLVASVRELVQSRPLRDGDTELMPSPLLALSVDPASPALPATPLVETIHALRPAVDEIEDANGPGHPGGPVRGGSGVIQRQSGCPRSAFLRDRLGASDAPFNRPGLDPARRGTLLHRILDDVWGRLGDSTTLAKTGADALDNIIQDAIDAASASARRVSGCGNAFFATQRVWLLNTLREWFELERARGKPFTVIAREESVTLRIEGLELGFKIDRIDRFDDGTLALIDYKTGGAQSIANWFVERPREPQLPLYALSREGGEEAVSVIAVARVRPGECTMDGLLDPLHHPFEYGLGEDKRLKVAAPENKSGVRDVYPDWENHLPRWGVTLGALAREFRMGDARINPARGGLCPDCRTPAFCRSATGFVDGEDADDGMDGGYHDG